METAAALYLGTQQALKDNGTALYLFELMVEVTLLVGAMKVAYTLYSWAYLLMANILRPILLSKYHLFENYGSENCWAVVTGGSDGIGLSMCHLLAK